MKLRNLIAEFRGRWQIVAVFVSVRGCRVTVVTQTALILPNQ